MGTVRVSGGVMDGYSEGEWRCDGEGEWRCDVGAVRVSGGVMVGAMRVSGVWVEVGWVGAMEVEGVQWMW